MPKLKAKRNRFVSMDNEFLTRKDLSLKAKGLLACMLCLPPDWRFSIEGLAYINKESESAISSALRELEQFDYLRRSYPRTKDVKIANAVYTICDIPIVEYEALHGENDDALNYGSGCRESIHLVSGRVQGAKSSAVVKCDGRLKMG